MILDCSGLKCSDSSELKEPQKYLSAPQLVLQNINKVEVSTIGKDIREQMTPNYSAHMLS